MCVLLRRGFPAGPALAPDLAVSAVHAGNLLFIVVELFLNEMCVSLFHGVFLVAQAIIYALVQWLLMATVHDYVYPYSFLDTSAHGAPYWYLGMLAAHLVFFLIAFALFKLRDCCRGPKAVRREFEQINYGEHSALLA